MHRHLHSPWASRSSATCRHGERRPSEISWATRISASSGAERHADRDRHARGVGAVDDRDAADFLPRRARDHDRAAPLGRLDRHERIRVPGIGQRDEPRRRRIARDDDRRRRVRRVGALAARRRDQRHLARRQHQRRQRQDAVARDSSRSRRAPRARPAIRHTSIARGAPASRPDDGERGAERRLRIVERDRRRRDRRALPPRATAGSRGRSLRVRGAEDPRTTTTSSAAGPRRRRGRAVARRDVARGCRARRAPASRSARAASPDAAGREASRREQGRQRDERAQRESMRTPHSWPSGSETRKSTSGPL